jgi:hypothetical protein
MCRFECAARCENDSESVIFSARENIFADPDVELVQRLFDFQVVVSAISTKYFLELFIPKNGEPEFATLAAQALAPEEIEVFEEF